MIRRKKYLFYKQLRICKAQQEVLPRLLQKSLQRNYQQHYTQRLSSLFKPYFVRSDRQFFKSMNKLQCKWTFSFSVPSKKLMHSRFFLNRAVDSLVYHNLQK